MKGIKGIARDTLIFILESASSMMPHEFAGLLRAEEGIITEVLMLPGTDSSNKGALIRLYMLPNMRVVGSVHSHPNQNLRPSPADLSFFSRTGDHHIIVCPPFNEDSWICYNAAGRKKELPLYDVKFDEDEGWQ